MNYLINTVCTGIGCIPSYLVFLNQSLIINGTIVRIAKRMMPSNQPQLNGGSILFAMDAAAIAGTEG